MMEHSFEKLYLSKDLQDSKKDIFVDKCPLIQHQLDGIRFLNRAFKKNKRGVILNDPSGCGKRVQTALFLSAMLPTLKKPVLILCREGRELLWKRHFQEWTAVSDDVTIELVNPLVKKKVVISMSYAAAVFARREWSILVVDDDLTKEVMKAPLRNELKIWITSCNIKEDLSTFCKFHSWVNPKEKFVSDKYIANKRDLRDVLTKAAMLDAYLEGTVLRRKVGHVFSGHSFKTKHWRDALDNNQVYTNNTEARTTKKNKDATGTKIKRTKRKSVDTTTTEDIPNKVARTKNTIENTVVAKNRKVTSTVTEATETVTEDFEIGDINAQDDEDFSPLRHNKTKQSRVLQWDSDTEDDEIDKTNKSQVDKNEDQNNSEIVGSGGQSNVLHWDSDTDSENGLKETISRLDVGENSMNCKLNEVSKTDLPAVANNEIDAASLSGSLLVETQILETFTKNDVMDKINPIPIISNNIKLSENLFSTDLTKNYMEKEVIGKTIPIVNNNKFSEDLFSTDLTTNPGEFKEIIYEPNDTQVTHSTKIDLKDNENLQKINRSKENEKQDETNKKTDQNSLENSNLSSFELKLKQMEELALKKFKGSFLDSIF